MEKIKKQRKVVEETIYKIETIRVKLKVSELPPKRKITTSEQALKFLKIIMNSLDDDQEHGILLTLDCQNNIRGYKILFSGGQIECRFDLKIIFRNALLLGAAGIIIAHNHPSENNKPSESDIIVTQDIEKGADILEIKLYDHIIMTRKNYFSFAEHNLLKE